MKTILASLLVITHCLSAELQHTQRGAYFVSQPGSTNVRTTSDISPQNYNKENLELLNDRVMARLREEAGSERGLYHVYLPDGRLQRVQYTAAPINSQQPQAAPSSRNQQELLEKQVEGPRGIYYVQVPEERLQSFQSASFQGQQASQPSQSSARYTQNPSEGKAEYKQEAAQLQSEYLPITVVTTDQLAQYRQAESNNQQTQAEFSNQAGDASKYQQTYFNNQAEQTVSNQQDSRSNQQFSARQQLPQEQTKGYLASIRYSQVEPINPPIYSYSPQSLVRVLRYAPYHL